MTPRWWSVWWLSEGFCRWVESLTRVNFKEKSSVLCSCWLSIAQQQQQQLVCWRNNEIGRAKSAPIFLQGMKGQTSYGSELSPLQAKKNWTLKLNFLVLLRFYEYYMAAKIFPTMKMEELFAVEVVHSALRTDSSPLSLPMTRSEEDGQLLSSDDDDYNKCMWEMRGKFIFDKSLLSRRFRYIFKHFICISFSCDSYVYLAPSGCRYPYVFPHSHRSDIPWRPEHLSQQIDV